MLLKKQKSWLNTFVLFWTTMKKKTHGGRGYPCAPGQSHGRVQSGRTRFPPVPPPVSAAIKNKNKSIQKKHTHDYRNTYLYTNIVCRDPTLKERSMGTVQYKTCRSLDLFIYYLPISMASSGEGGSSGRSEGDSRGIEAMALTFGAVGNVG